MYDHKNIEKEISEFWEKKKIQEKAVAKNRGSKGKKGENHFIFAMDRLMLRAKYTQEPAGIKQ